MLLIGILSVQFIKGFVIQQCSCPFNTYRSKALFFVLDVQQLIKCVERKDPVQMHINT